LVGSNPLGRTVDLMYGGGSCFFLPKDNPSSCRNDTKDVFGLAELIGWKVQNGIDDFKNDNDSTLPIINLFANDHMAYDIDRDHKKEPSLKEMAMKALNLLNLASKKKKTGFFIMIEGSKIGFF
jgi:alkaline phosphatase